MLCNERHWHGPRFDIITGKVATPSLGRPEPTLQVQIEVSAILVRNQNE
jgi:nitrite reductase/ring-hydroxylating ferredoxin subunit